MAALNKSPAPDAAAAAASLAAPVTSPPTSKKDLKISKRPEKGPAKSREDDEQHKQNAINIAGPAKFVTFDDDMYYIFRKKVHTVCMYEVYTDGSCLGNPGRGGWGVVSKDFTLSGNLQNTTNNVMEMTAVIKALEHCVKNGYHDVRIFTDSNYVKNGISSWIYNWKRNGWKTSSGSDVKNKQLWIHLDTIRRDVKTIDWKWVKAHNGNPMNEKVDKLARECAKNLSA